MKITVAICTWNRCALLGQTLERMAQLSIPADVEWELLVVNNNSTDATEPTAAEFADRLPLKLIFEAEPGLSNARNRAVRETSGDYILWTDDDVLVDQQWLAAYCAAFRQWPDAAIFGGNIEPWFEGTPPAWLPLVWQRVASAYASRDMGQESVALSSDVIPFGANFAVRTEEQRRYSYDPSLGVRPDSIMGGEETTMVRNMMAEGISGRWVADARVRHYIPKERQTIAYLRRYFKAYGEYCAKHDGDDASPKVFGMPRWLWREALMAEVKYRVRRHSASAEVWIEDLIAASQAMGQLKGYREMSGKLQFAADLGREKF
jgi:glycosyltransferase involved in cell wall biosynthesis